MLNKRLLIALLAAFLASAAAAAEGVAAPFRIATIRAEGLTRISEGTLFNYLPLQPGEQVDAAKLAAALRSVYRSGFFRDVEFRRDGDDLVIVVEERPAIESFSISGNKEIKTEDLERVLVRSGLAEGRIFDRSVLDQVTQELVRQYHSRGRYGVKVEADVADTGVNQVRIAIVIKEGQISGIRQINIVGNESYTDEQLVDRFELATPGFFNWITEGDRYAREKLGADLETLRSFYMDRGYADFRVESTQVTVSGDRQGVYITIGIHEGEIFKIKDTRLVGDLPVPEAELRQLILARDGSQFSMARVNATSELIKSRLGVDGFAFAEVTPFPELDQQTKEVGITFLIEPGARAYVRRLKFSSDSDTHDEVYRREARQLEGTWLSNRQVDRTRLRIARLPYVEDVEHKVERLEGTEDQVEVSFDVKERSAGNFTAGVGFGGTSTGAYLDFSITHSNFLGTGNRVSLALQSRSYSQSLNFSFTQPYWTIDGVSRTVSLYYQTSDALGRDLETFSRENFGGSVSFRWPLSEYSAFSTGVSILRSDLAVNAFSASPSVYAFVTNPNHGDPYVIDYGFGQRTVGTVFDSVIFNGSWSFDTRNRAIFADRGTYRLLGVDVALYPGDVEWWGVRATELHYLSMPFGFTYAVNAELALVKAYGASADVPPDRKLFGGGADSVRGFRDSYLGPRYLSTAGRELPTGGNLRVSVQNEFLIPNFLADDPSAPPKTGRFGLFVDFGMVFADTSDFSFAELRASAGLGATFLTPLGALRFSFAYPFRSEDTDETERFQFTIGTLF